MCLKLGWKHINFHYMKHFNINFKSYLKDFIKSKEYICLLYIKYSFNNSLHKQMAWCIVMNTIIVKRFYFCKKKIEKKSNLNKHSKL